MADDEQELVARLAAIEFGPQGASSPLGLPMASVIVRALLAEPTLVLRVLGGEDNGFVPVLRRGGGRKVYAEWRFLVSED